MGLDFSGSPNAGIYAEQAAQANEAYQQALSNVAAKRSQFYNETGFNVKNNPDGSIASYGVDGKNLTGQYQQMERAQGRQLEGQHEADMARHIGGAGIGAQNLSALRYGNGVAQASFANNFLGNNDQFVQEQAQAGSNLQNTLLQLQLQAISDARAGQTFPGSGDGTGGDGSGTGGDGSPSTPTKGYISPVLRAAATRPYAVKVKANKTGGSANKKQGIFAIH